jgi:transposase
MKKQVFWGIDISKNALDVCIEKDGKELLNFQVENSPSKIRMAFSHYMAQKELRWEECVFCMENTGIYGYHLQRYLHKNVTAVYVVNPLHLKRSMGLVRGKNDKIDAQRITRFIAKNHEELKSHDMPGETIEHLRVLTSKRKQYVKILQALKQSTGELKCFEDKKTMNVITKAESLLIKNLKNCIKKIDCEITAVVTKNKELAEIKKRICTVPGVGPVLSTALIITTNGFKRLNQAGALSCYAGVVPFEFSSGSSIYRKPKVSSMGDKTLKKLLHLAALRTIQLPGELREYYLKKVAQGKNKMLVINAIRHKILLRVCAVMKNGKNYSPPLLLS